MYVLVSELIIMQRDSENRGPAPLPKLIKLAGGCSFETAANVNTERLRSAVQFTRLAEREKKKKNYHPLFERQNQMTCLCGASDPFSPILLVLLCVHCWQ